MITVYVAGPYSNPDPAEVEANTQRAMDAGDELEDAGFAACIPHLSHFRHQRKPRGYEHWMAVDFELLSRCDALLRLPDGPLRSCGADREVAFAESREIPVFHSVEEVEAWVKGPAT